MVDEVNDEMATFDPIEVGDVVTGIVTKVEEKHALIDVNYKIDGVLPISELSSIHVDKVSDVISVGDQLTLKVTKVNEEDLVLSKKEVDADQSWGDLERKFNNKEIFTVEIKDVVKGGLVANLGVRGFMPASLVERQFVDSFEDYKGKELDVKIVELDPNQRKVILSHRAVLDAQADELKQQTLKNLSVGDVVEGTVQRLTDFGAFIDIGGVDGLAHISQLAHHHVDTPADVVSEGDVVKVHILSIDQDNERISLSIKDTLPGPWEAAAGKLQANDVLEGTVKRLVPFGAFVELYLGIEGLVHVSEISHQHIGTPNEVLAEGDQVKVKVLDVNLEQKRISLSIRALEEQSSTQESELIEQEESKGFSLGDVIGDQLKNYKK